MTRSGRMKPVVEVADRQEKEQARRLGEAQQILDQQRHKLEQLIAYRDDYSRQFEHAGSAGFPASRLQDYRIFLGRVNEAIEQQKAAITEAEGERDRQRQKWLACRTKSRALDKVVDRYEQEERRRRDRHEQKESDDFALQRHPRKKS